METFNKIYKIVATIPKGKVMTYKQISDVLKINNPRVIGFALHANKNPEKVPCHRVIRSDGTLAKGYAFGGQKIQKEKLKKEGVHFFNNGKVDINNSLYEKADKSERGS